MRSIVITTTVWFMATTVGLTGSESAAQGFEEVTFTTRDGGTIHANLYGSGSHALLLAHGAVFDKESWHDQAVALSDQGLRVLAIDFRGYGDSSAGDGGNALYQDVLGGIRYLHDAGAERVSVLGASMGGGAAGQAAVVAEAGDITKLILLAAVPVATPERLQGDKLFIVAEGDSMRDAVEEQYERAGEPKTLTILNGSAHAQHIFRSDRRGAELTEAIVAFLTD
jgi:esterase/lipase